MNKKTYAFPEYLLASDIKRCREILSTEEASIYSIETRNRVKKVIFEQMRRYSYLF